MYLRKGVYFGWDLPIRMSNYFNFYASELLDEHSKRHFKQTFPSRHSLGRINDNTLVKVKYVRKFSNGRFGG